MQVDHHTEMIRAPHPVDGFTAEQRRGDCFPSPVGCWGTDEYVVDPAVRQIVGSGQGVGPYPRPPWIEWADVDPCVEQRISRFIGGRIR